jgi:hypothetical protein
MLAFILGMVGAVLIALIAKLVPIIGNKTYYATTLIIIALFYIFMDDWVVLAPTRWRLRKAIRIVKVR